jgi:hypothetical protein
LVPVPSPLKEISWLLGMMPNLCFLFYYFLAPSDLRQPVQVLVASEGFGMVITSSVYMNGMARQLEGVV